MNDRRSALSSNRLAGYFLAAVWLANGFLAKVLGLVPRHQEIVARFFGAAAAPSLTKLIGLAEIAIAIWIVGGRRRRICFGIQALAILSMNSLELWQARDLLLFPRLMPIANACVLGIAWWWSGSESTPPS